MEMWWLVYSSTPRYLRKLIDGDKDACRAVSDFMPTLTGGDGDDTQYCKQSSQSRKARIHLLEPHDTATILVYVGYWPTQSSVVVAHQGTNPSELYVPTFSSNRTLIHILITPQFGCSDRHTLPLYDSRP
jgi:hypothetical protein